MFPSILGTDQSFIICPNDHDIETPGGLPSGVFLRTITIC